MTEEASLPAERDESEPDIGFEAYLLNENARYKGRLGALSAQDGVLHFNEAGIDILSIPLERVQKAIITGVFLTVICDGRKYRFSHRKSFGFSSGLLLRGSSAASSAYQAMSVVEQQMNEWRSYFEKKGVPILGSYKTAELSMTGTALGILCIILGGLTGLGALESGMSGTADFSHNFEKMFTSIWLVGALPAVLVGVYILIRNKPLGMPNAISRVGVPGVQLINLLLVVCGILYCVLGIHIMQNPELLPKNSVGGQMMIGFGALHFTMAAVLFFYAWVKGIDTLHYQATDYI